MSADQQCNRLFVAGVLLLTVALDSVQSYTECPPETVRLISTDDIEDASVTMGTGFENVLTTSTLMEENFRYFHETAIPNPGEILFKERFLLTGLTTAGFKQEPAKPDQFVSNFTFLYSSSTTGPFQEYGMHGTPDNATETAYFVSSPLLARKIRLVVNDAELGLGDYYWRINLFGCSEDDGIDKENSKDTRSTAICTSVHTVTQTIIITASPSSRDCTSDLSPQPLSRSCDVPFYATIATSILLVITVIALIVTLICCCICIKRKSNGQASRRERSGTVREVQNTPLYTMEKQNNYDMINNEAYSPSHETVSSNLEKNKSTNPSSGVEASTKFLVSTSSSTQQLIPAPISSNDEVIYTELDDNNPTISAAVTTTAGAVYEHVDN